MGGAVLGYFRYTKTSKDKAVLILAKSSKNAMEEYVMDNPFASSATLALLTEKGYLEKPRDPYLSNSVCQGRVEEVSRDTNQAISKVEYKVILCCHNHNFTYQNDRLFPNDICGVE